MCLLYSSIATQCSLSLYIDNDEGGIQKKEPSIFTVFKPYLIMAECLFSYFMWKDKSQLHLNVLQKFTIS